MSVKELPNGVFTALVTPFTELGEIDWPGLEKNIQFQIQQGVKGIVPAGTTGESPTITPEEHVLLITRVAGFVAGQIFVLAGTGSNSTAEALHYTTAALHCDCDGVLLVDCYYNGPSSLELREEYYARLANHFPKLTIVPYIIPGRTGCALSPEDLAILHRQYENISAVKEATGDLERMRKTRQLLGSCFKIFSGDDDMTLGMMTDLEIRASGVISVISNIAPAAIQMMCQNVFSGTLGEAQKIRDALNPLFGLVTVCAKREEIITSFVLDKFRNPVGIKTIMQGLGMPVGVCRPPLGKMTKAAVETARSGLREVWEQNPWILKPIEDFYGVSIKDRLANDRIWQKLAY